MTASTSALVKTTALIGEFRDPRRRHKISSRENLLTKVRRSVQQEPAGAVSGNRSLRLCSRTRLQSPGTHTHALSTCAIPLWEAAPGRGAENSNAHTGTLKDDRWARSRDYSSALAYELISQFRSISSCCGVVHSMVMAPVETRVSNFKPFSVYHEPPPEGRTEAKSVRRSVASTPTKGRDVVQEKPQPVVAKISRFPAIMKKHKFFKRPHVSS